MIQIYHYPLCPFSRILRIVLNENKVPFELIEECFWNRRQSFLQLNPAGQTPVMLHPEIKIPIAGNWAILEFLQDAYKCNIKDYKDDYDIKIYSRFLLDWFCNKFYNEVIKYIFNEKIIKVLTQNSSPNSNFIRAAKKNMLYHMDYITYLLKQSGYYILGERMSLIDYVIAAQLSTLDYLGDVPWERNELVKEWYALIKSRPSFREILNDEIPEINCSKHYRNIDF